MGWLIIVLGLVVAGFAIPRLGKVLLVLLGVLVVLIVVAGLWLYERDQQNKHEREVAKTRISVSQIELSELRLGGGRLVGRIRNHSQQYALDELRLKLTMRDCNAKAECEVVGETEVTVYTDVPAGQSRDVDEYVYFNHLGQTRGKHEWDYRVLEILGK